MGGDGGVEFFWLTAMEGDDGEEVFFLLGGEVVDLARDFAEDVAGIEHEHFFAQLFWFGLVEEPKLARHDAGVKEVGTDGDHGIDGAGFDQFLANLCFFVTC